MTIAEDAIGSGKEAQLLSHSAHSAGWVLPGLRAARLLFPNHIKPGSNPSPFKILGAIPLFSMSCGLIASSAGGR